MQEHVQKLRIPVRLAQPGLDPADGWLMLWPQAGPENRPETLIEHLNSTRIVVPFIQESDRQVVLLVRANVDWVALRTDADRRLALPPSYQVTHRQQAQLLFVDGNQIECTIEWDHTDPRTRLSDFLNATPDFFPARMSFGLVLVNRRHVRQIRLGSTQPERISGPAPSVAQL